MPAPTLPPEWVHEALAIEARAFFGPDVEPADDAGSFAVALQAGRGRFTMKALAELFGEGAIQLGDELVLQLFWQPHEAPQRRAQRAQYGTLLDYEGFASRAQKLYRAWHFVSSHFPFEDLTPTAVKTANDQLHLEFGSARLQLPMNDFEVEGQPDFGRPLRARLEALGLVRAPSSPAEWFSRFRQEHVSFARDIVFRTDHAAEGKVSVEVLVQQEGAGTWKDRRRIFCLFRDARGELKSVGCSSDRPTMPGVMHQSIEGTQVVIAPFAWNSCPVRVIRGRPLGEKFEEWLERWFDAPKAADEKTFCGAIHSVSVPTESATGYEFRVDFGSAPARAAIELIALLAPGAAAVTVGVEPHELSVTS